MNQRIFSAQDWCWCVGRCNDARLWFFLVCSASSGQDATLATRMRYRDAIRVSWWCWFWRVFGKFAEAVFVSRFVICDSKSVGQRVSPKKMHTETQKFSGTWMPCCIEMLDGLIHTLQEHFQAGLSVFANGQSEIVKEISMNILCIIIDHWRIFA